MKFLTYDDIEPYAKRIPNGSWWRPVPGHDWDIWLRACIEKHEPKEAVMDYSGIVDFRNDDSYELSEIQIIIAGEYAGVKGYINISVDDQSVAHMPHGIQETWKSVRRDTGKKVWPYEQIIIGPIIEYVRQYAVLTKEEQGREITSILRRYGCCMPPDYLLLDPCDVNKRVGWQMNELKQYFHEYRISSQMEFAMIDGKCCKIPESMHDPEENVEMPPLADRISYEVNRSLGLDEQFGILYPAVCNGFGGVAVMMSPFSISLSTSEGL